MPVGHEGEHADDQRDADDVPPDADVVEQRDDPHAEGVEQPVQQQDRREQQDGVAGVVVNPNCRSRYALRKLAAPKSMPAVTATWPSTLNQPANHAQAAALRAGASL